MTLVPGTRLGAYEILSAIGAGGMGEVYRARDTLTQKLEGGHPESISPDGRTLLVRRGAFDLFLLPLEAGAKLRPLLAEPFAELNGDISRDGRWIAYQSSESGRNEIYVRPFPNVDAGRWQISPEGGRYPLWARSGRELFYVTPANHLMVVPLQTGSGFQFGPSQRLFDASPYMSGPVGRTFDISPDGQRFVMSRSAGSDSSARPSVVIVTNWAEALERLVPTK